MESLCSSETSLSVYHSTLRNMPEDEDSQISDVFFKPTACKSVLREGYFGGGGLQLNAAYDPSIHEVSRSHTTTHHSR